MFRKLLFLCIASLVSTCVFAQKQGQQLIDSLIMELNKAKEDTNKALLFGDISVQSYVERKYKMCYDMALKQEKLSRKLKWQKGLILSKSNIALYDFYQKRHAIAFEKMISSFYELGKLNDNYRCRNTAQNLGALYDEVGDLDNSKKWKKKWLELCIVGADREVRVHALQSLGMNYAWVGNMDSCLYYWEWSVKLQDSLAHEAEAAVIDNIGKAFLKIHDGFNARKYFERLLAKDVRNKDVQAVAWWLGTIATTYWEEKKMDKAIEYYFKSIQLYKLLNDNKGVALTYDHIGALYVEIGDYTNALKYYLTGLKIAEKVNDNLIYPVLLTDVTAVYERTKQYNKALEYLFKARNLFNIKDVSTDSTFILTTVNMNLGAIYTKMKKYDSAIYYTNYALELKSKDKNLLGMAGIIEQLGSIYLEQKKFDKALRYYEEALEACDQSVEKRELSLIHTNIGIAYLHMMEDSVKQYLNQALKAKSTKDLIKKSINSLDKALALSKEIGTVEFLIDIYSNLSKVHEFNGAFQEALNNHKLYLEIKDSLFNSDKIKEITSLDLQYDFDKKENATKAANEKKIALQRENHKANLTIAGVSAFSLIAFISGTFYVRRKREKDKFQLELNATKQEALNAQMSDHFISNAMDSINHFIKNNEKEKASIYLVKFSRLIRNVLENAQKKLVTLQEDLTILEDYLDLEKLRFDDEKFGYQISIDEKIDPKNTLIPPMIFQTLAENAIKHGFRRKQGGILKIGVRMSENQIICLVEDNGAGRGQFGASSLSSTNRKSYGSSLAERLIKTVSKYGKDTTYKIIDLFDKHNTPIGTMVRFTIPRMVAE